MKYLIITILLALIAIQPASSSAIYDERFDEFTGKDDSVIFIFSEEEMEDFFYLAWGCYSERLSLTLNHKILGGNLAGEVIIRTKFEENGPTEATYHSLSRSRKATIFSDIGVNGVNLLTVDAIQSEKFMLRVTDSADGEEITGTFRADGLNDALNKLPCFPKQAE